MKKLKFDVLVVGAGLSGAVVAERFASKNNKKVLIIDKRDHVGGNCYDYIDENGIRINKYGAHVFHTNFEDVWQYVQKFSKWVPWSHESIASIDGKLIKIPVNINTVNALYGTYIKNEAEMDSWLKKVQMTYKKMDNSEKMGKSRVGSELYEKIFKHYTFKQWDKYPKELDPLVLARIPVKNNFDNRHFNDKYQALPKDGYTNFINNILKHPNITVKINTDFFKIKNTIEYDTIIYTGPIDRYFENSGLEKLEYRSIKFIKESHKHMNYYQINSIVNYPQMDVPFTRIVEYKHFLNQKSPHTTIVKEISTASGEPYYPVPNKRNHAVYEKYRKLAEGEKNVHFLGRLASYKYFNMDEAIKNSLDFFNNYNKKK